MQVKATELAQQSANQDSQPNQLDNRYGKIGISAVAAALRHLSEPQSPSEYRIPYDRD